MIADILFKHLARGLRRRGNRARDARRWNRAAYEYRRYLALRPEDAAIWVQLGHALSEAGRLAAADRAYCAAWELTPDDADLLLCWAHSRKRAGDVQSARELYARSMKIDGNAVAAREFEELALPGERGLKRFVEHQDEDSVSVPPRGRIERTEGQAVFGHALAPDGWQASEIEFRVGGTVVGHVVLDSPFRGDRQAFKTLVDVNGESEVAAFCLPDGRELEGSPFRVEGKADHHRPKLAPEARAQVLKPFVMGDATEVALFATRSRSGALQPHVGAYIEALREQGITVLLVAVTERPLNIPGPLLDQLAGAIVRESRGDEFGAWAHGLALYPELYDASLMLLLTDTVVGPAHGDRFAAVMARIRGSHADLLGLTESYEHGWHLQSFFLALRSRVVASPSLQRFFGEVSLDQHDHDNVPARRFTRQIEENGHRTEVLFPSPVASNPLVRGWLKLIRDGFPFVLLSLLRGVYSDAELDDWRDRLVAAGFDVALIDAAIAAADEDVPQQHDDRLSARSIAHDRGTDRRLDIALYGPWNYDGDAGAAARGLAAAIRRTGARLNLHPARQPFETHRPLYPAVDAIDFHGTPDIAVVAFNPGDWNLLTHDQHEAVRSASYRIGYWAGAVSAGVAALQPGLASVDRIWVPGRECADLFASGTDAPVDIIPPLRLSAPQPGGAPDEVGPTAPPSCEVVAGLIERSLRATMARRGPPPVWPAPRIEASLLAGIRFEVAPLGDRIRGVPLAADGAPLTNGNEPALAGISDGDTNLIALAPKGSLVTPLFSRIVADHSRRRPDVDIFYADDFAAETDETIDQIRLKPEFDLTLLAAQDYVGAPLIVTAPALAALGGLDAAMRTAATADLLFRAHARGMSIARIPEVLLAHPGRRVRATTSDYRAMLAAQPSLPYAILPGRAPDSFALSRRFASASTPAVTVVVPTRRGTSPGAAGSHIEQLLARLAETDWPMDRLRVIIGDDVAGEPHWASGHPFALRRIETPRSLGEPFNYAIKMNRLWREADTEQIVFMNDDVLPRDRGWLKALQTFALDETVGGVGARLLFEGGSLQHAGLVPHGVAAGHAWVRRRRVQGTYQSWALVHREWSMMTGAVFATRRRLMEQVEGFDEQFRLEFNDTDLCLRLRLLGYRIVYTPYAEMTHVERASRGEALPPGVDLARFLARWSSWIDTDPSWHPQLDRDRVEVTPRRDSLAWYL